MRTFALAAACIVIAAPAVAQSPAQVPSRAAPAPAQTQVAPPAVQPGNPSTSGIASSPMTADFVKKVAISDMFEIQSSKLAQQKGDADSKTFAAKMVTDHSKTTSELKAILKKAKVQAELPKALDAEHQQKLDALKKASGADFNRLYDEAQRKGHQDAIALFQRYAAMGDNQELKAWAQKTLPHLEQHLQMSNQLK
jgi:putative membrane protein